MPLNKETKLNLYDNTRSHSVRMTLERILNLDWFVLLHPLYSPDIVPSDFHL